MWDPWEFPIPRLKWVLAIIAALILAYAIMLLSVI
jgi:hypothetical protein